MKAAKAKAEHEAEERNNWTNDERSGAAWTAESSDASVEQESDRLKEEIDRLVKENARLKLLKENGECSTMVEQERNRLKQESHRLKQESDRLRLKLEQQNARLKQERDRSEQVNARLKQEQETARLKQDNVRLKQWKQTGNAKCRHAADTFHSFLFNFTTAFNESFCDARDRDSSLSRCLTAAHNATLDKYADVWYDSAKMQSVISYFLFYGTQDILDGDYNHARENATFARYFEQHMAFQLKETQAIFRWNKIHEAQKSDQHTLVRFFQRRILCSCLDDKYDEVKSITKLGLCFNPRCNCPDRLVEHSKTMYCDRCRSVTYCSRECQKFDWSRHKTNCEKEAARIAEFEASKKQS